MKMIEKSIILAMILTVLFSFCGFAEQCENISDRVLRLHVLANSDSKEDQDLKLKVRDRILEESKDLLSGVTGKEEAKEKVEQALPAIQKIAEDEIQKQGYNYSVQVELTNMYFTTREYDTITLPAGEYDALRISIGKAEGHNWWCVIFPQMCLPAAEEKQELSDVLNAKQMEIVEGKYELKFKTLEIYEQVREWLSGT